LHYVPAAGYLWLFTEKGNLWRTQGRRWEKITLPFPLKEPAPYWDSLSQSLWIGNAAQLLAWRAQEDVFYLYDIDSVTQISRDGPGRLWLLRHGQVMGEKRTLPPLPSHVRFIAPSSEGLWMGTDSAVFLWEGETLWEVARGSYQLLTTDAYYRLWVQPLHRKSTSPLCWEPMQRSQGPNLKVSASPKGIKVSQNFSRELREWKIGEKTGLARTARWMGATPSGSLWWQVDAHLLRGLSSSSLKDTTLDQWWGMATFPLPLQYTEMLTSLPVHALQEGSWEGEQGYFLRSGAQLWFRRKVDPPPLLPPRLRTMASRRTLGFTGKGSPVSTGNEPPPLSRRRYRIGDFRISDVTAADRQRTLARPYSGSFLYTPLHTSSHFSFFPSRCLPSFASYRVPVSSLRELLPLERPLRRGTSIFFPAQRRDLYVGSSLPPTERTLEPHTELDFHRESASMAHNGCLYLVYSRLSRPHFMVHTVSA
ncbi:MAG: hypothetical protein N2170_07355, partial [Bacteroidia bacterium]|nr:hypothetical protein [Bacteroidia bacterium]